MMQKAIATIDRDCAPFPTAALPEPCRGFVLEASVAIGCDPCYLAVPMISALAGTIGNARSIQLKRGWIEPSVIWSAIVGPSGTVKSPALDAVLGPLHEMQAVLLQAHSQAI